jgi:hypothetical protein
MTSLIFHNNSLLGEFVISDLSFTIVFTVENITHITDYLMDVPLGTVVGSLEIRNPFGGALLTGAIYYTQNIGPRQFTTDIVTLSRSDTIGIIVLNFAYLGSTPLISNDIFGGAKLTYTIPNPYVSLTVSGSILTISPMEPINNVEPNIEIFPNPNPCFFKGTNILTDTGYKKIEDLKANNTITVFSRSQKKNIETKILKIHKFTTKFPENLCCVKKNSVSNLVPNTDLFISDGHALMIEDKFRHVGCLIKFNDLIKPIKIHKYIVTYYHIQLTDWFDQMIIANGLPCESYYCPRIKDLNGDKLKPIEWTCNSDECCYKLL